MKFTVRSTAGAAVTVDGAIGEWTTGFMEATAVCRPPVADGGIALPGIALPGIAMGAADVGASLPACGTIRIPRDMVWPFGVSALISSSVLGSPCARAGITPTRRETATRGVNRVRMRPSPDFAVFIMYSYRSAKGQGISAKGGGGRAARRTAWLAPAGAALGRS